MEESWGSRQNPYAHAINNIPKAHQQDVIAKLAEVISNEDWDQIEGILANPQKVYDEHWLQVSTERAKAFDANLTAAKETGDWSNLSQGAVDKAAAEIVMTTSIFVAGREIEKEIEVLTAECVFGMNMFRDFFASVRDVFGGRSAATQKVLRDARKTALTELRREALIVGADAVIGIDLYYQELSGGGKGGILMIVASGTAVSLAVTC